MAMADDRALARRIGLTAAVMTGLGVVIGSGIYVILGIAAGPAGNAVWLSFLIAAAGASFTAFTYARLARDNPQNSPEFQYVGGAFGRLPGFLAGWLILVAQIVSAATVALGFAGYLHALTGFPELPAAVILIVVSVVIIFFGISHSTMAAGLLTVVEIIGLLIVIGIGSTRLGDVDYLEMPSGLFGVFTGASLVFFAYLGFEGMANLAGEMRNPRRDMPRAITLVLVISTILYTLVALSAVSTLGWESLSQSRAPFSDIAREALGSRAGSVMAVISLASTANTVLVLLLAGSRIAHALSAGGVLPAPLSRVSPRTRAPWLALLAVGLLALIFSLFGDVRQVAEYTNFTTLLAFIAVNASAFMLLRRSRPGIWPDAVVNRVLPALGIGFSIWLAITAGKGAAAFGGIAIAAGISIYATNSIMQKAANDKGTTDRPDGRRKE